jgi:hypothetical protein
MMDEPLIPEPSLWQPMFYLTCISIGVIAACLMLLVTGWL